jgi:hypothetical protein
MIISHLCCKYITMIKSCLFNLACDTHYLRAFNLEKKNEKIRRSQLSKASQLSCHVPSFNLLLVFSVCPGLSWSLIELANGLAN